jgi:phosphoribosyl-AMP cyclohydrolase
MMQSYVSLSMIYVYSDSIFDTGRFMVLDIDFTKGSGLVPVIVQDDETKEVLMLAYMNREAWLKTLETGKATYWSRSRNELWVKGETSGHVQMVKEMLIDCDSDTLLLKVHQVGGAACHTGNRSCFFKRVVAGETEIVGELVFKPEDVYK